MIQLLGSRELSGNTAQSTPNNQLPIPRTLIDVCGVHLFVLPGINQSLFPDYTIATELPAGQG